MELKVNLGAEKRQAHLQSMSDLTHVIFIFCSIFQNSSVDAFLIMTDMDVLSTPEFPGGIFVTGVILISRAH